MKKKIVSQNSKKRELVSAQKKETDTLRMGELGGVSLGGFQATRHFADHQILNSSRGHGFAAEKMNNLIDRMFLNQAEIVGANNLKKGPDRLVNGVYFQTKYCQTAQESIGALFEKGQYSYFNSDGTPMKAEIPPEQYDEAITVMRRYIEAGKVPGVTNPDEATNLIKKGSVTYKQAVNMAKFETVESLSYDLATGVVTSTFALGISAAITFAQTKWNGGSNKEAFDAAMDSASKVFVVTLVAHVGAQQLSRTAISKTIERGTTRIAMSLPKGIRNGLAKGINPGVTPNSVASINTVSKALRGNIITGLVTTGVLSIKDIWHFSRNEISGLQCFKNIAVTGAGVFSGSLGFWGGAAMFAWAGPVGMFVGGLAVASATGYAGSSGMKALVDLIGEDDVKMLKEILQKELKNVLVDYLVMENEMPAISGRINNVKWEDRLKQMHASPNRKQYAYNLFEEIVKDVVRNRIVVKV